MNRQPQHQEEKPNLRQRRPDNAVNQFAPPFPTAASAAALQRMPRGGTGGMRRQAVMQLQRRYGNAYVQRMLPNFNMPSFGNVSSNATGAGSTAGAAAASGSTGPAAAPTSISDGGATVSASGGSVDVDAPVVNIRAGIINLDSAYTKTSGILEADTLIANTVAGSSYTPGAGNIW